MPGGFFFLSLKIQVFHLVCVCFVLQDSSKTCHLYSPFNYTVVGNTEKIFSDSFLGDSRTLLNKYSYEVYKDVGKQN